VNSSNVSTLPSADERGLHAYHILRAATEMFGRQPGELEASQLGAATQRAAQARALEDLVLASTNGRRVTIPGVEVDDAVERIQQRFDDEIAFEKALLESGVTVTDLRRALWRELAFDAVMSMIGDEADPVSDAEVEAYYAQNPKPFQRPEQRTVRHILITINDDYAENTVEQATLRITAIKDHLAQNPSDFAIQANTHSECPSALEGGLLGHFSPGKLYSEIDDVLFNMAEGELAGPIQTEAGLHLVLCEKIEPAAVITLEEAREKLRQHLGNKRRKARQQAWIKTLK
jgi:nitrogen fixation protein NifM